jgi:hypothetical protein
MRNAELVWNVFEAGQTPFSVLHTQIDLLEQLSHVSTMTLSPQEERKLGMYLILLASHVSNNA